MTGERRRFTVTAPDWGQDHLLPDAVVAFVDGELADRPFSRATRHLAECPECATQVVAQGQARSALRSAECPILPSSLLSSLRSIPQDAELPGPPAGLAMTADGRLVTVLRSEPAPRRPVGQHGRRPPVPRRFKFGAGAAVSGLALGALALGAPGMASGPPPAATGNDRGVFNGSLVGSPGGADANLRLAPLPRPEDRIHGSFTSPR